ncbi:hypothetical protein AA958_10995 [Streptomyces sp. CNQ-509]|uniref:GH116 family glycosyl hydrolase n=1 Tax=Streptomyces sp. CNQ-509 TaxID=444103 RepID=UPI00062DEFF0|nr:GH116 family glycosyl hydrolase [Streptomyces sp. CNQ-509]AKH82667.1 hypothetical protein AA958_10995 [Streptomyces sp. CNQ-509]
MTVDRAGRAGDHDCRPGTGCCPPHGSAVPDGLNRRGFVALGAAAAVALGLPPRSAVAVPADKGLGDGWFKELRRRGEATAYRGDALENVGMPVGGIAAGQVYLAGDGRLWLWEVDNPDSFPYGGADWQGIHYAEPLPVTAPFATGFALRWASAASGGTASLDGDGFADVVFRGRYPLGTVTYADPGVPLAVTLDAYSPFIPTSVDDSSLPVTVLDYTLRNTANRPLTAELLGFAENPVCLRSRTAQPVTLTAAPFEGAATGVQFGARAGTSPEPPRGEIVFEDWERTDYSRWTATGTAFGPGPVTEAECPDYFKRFGDLGVSGTRFVTSHHFRAGGDAAAADGHTGKLVSEPFIIERRYIAVAVGGGSQAGTACVNVVVDGETVASFTGRNAEPMSPRAYDVSAHEGKRATIEIVDESTGGWGHVNVDRIRFTDTPVAEQPLGELTDHGTFALAAAHPAARVRPSVADWSTPDALFDSADAPAETDGGRARPTGGQAGTVTVPVRLAPGETARIRFTLAWHFDRVDRQLFGYLTGAGSLRRHYGTRFADARAAAAHTAARGDELAAATREFVRTWYEDATLPHWFLERTLAPASTLATSTVHRFQDGRFYAWEGLYCCDGTCTHVWNYAQSAARLFPALERDTRERVDLGLAFHEDTGAVDYRGEAARHVAHDGQCGNVLRTYREHLMAPDSAFLTRVWPRVKKATAYLIRADALDGRPADGVLEGEQYHTLDASWYGEIPWISGLYVAALHAAAAMADEMADAAFAAECRELAARGTKELEARMWNERYGYFEHLVDPAHADAINSNRGCHIDQMYGETYAFQLGLPRVFPGDKARTALANLYRHNFLPDAQSYKDVSGIPGGRIYSTEGEAGTVMCTWPFGGSDTAPGGGEPFAIGYFNEVWTGQEYQFAAHLMHEGMTDEALAVTRAVHDRHSAEKRNPYNEIECSDHYARAMMSHAVYLAATGFDYHGPHGRLGFAPRLEEGQDFAAAFVTAEGWGLYRQRRRGHTLTARAELRYGTLRLTSLAAPARAGARATAEAIGRDGRRRRVAVRGASAGKGRVAAEFAEAVTLQAGETLEVTYR